MIVIVPEYEVAAVGANVTVTFWLDPAGTDRLVGLTENAPLLLETLETVSGPLPVLRIINANWLLLPTLTLPNVNDDADTPIVGVAAPLPVTVTTVGLPLALCVR